MKNITLIILVFAFAANAFGQANPREILDAVCKKAKEISLYSSKIDWDDLQKKVYAKAENAKTINDLKPAFETLLNGLRDHHGKIMNAKDFSVPCLLINPLVENAIKHGLQTSPKPLRIKISAKLNGEKLVVEVGNTGRLDEIHDSNGTKIGLKNVRERLEKLFGENGKFELKENGEFVIARIEIQK